MEERRELLSIREAEAAYDVSRSTLYRYVQQGRLTPRRRPHDRHTYFAGEDLEEALRPARAPAAGTASAPQGDRLDDVYRELGQLRRASVLDAPARAAADSEAWDDLLGAVAEVSARWRGPGAVEEIRAQRG